jgi:hypothetical protein
MPSITSWMRLEPRSRNAEMNTSLQARIYDPLWLLGRQWQLGEFQGEDNGSPVMARWRGEGARLTRYHSGAIAPNTRGNRYDGSRMPLETLAERETIRPANHAMDRRFISFACRASQRRWVRRRFEWAQVRFAGRKGLTIRPIPFRGD